MSQQFDVITPSRRLRFHSDLSVEEVNAAGTAVKTGTWESFSGENENEISYRFDNEPRTSLAARYRFNDRNQLQVLVPQQPGVTEDSALCTFPGFIEIDDELDLEYTLIDDTGKKTPHKLYVYGQLDLLRGTDRLRLTFADATTTEILGIDGVESVSADEYALGGDIARDRLWFKAVTTNTVDGTDLDFPATIQFVGRWDLYEGSLALVVKYDSTGTKPLAAIALGGRVKGTNFGLVLEQDGQFALQIAGKYQWKQSSLSWELSLGHSTGNTFNGRLKLDANIKGKAGKLQIKGGLTLEKGDQALQVQLELGLTYTAEWGALEFRVNNAGGGYQIFFGGQIKLAKGRVTFSITFDSSPGNRRLEAEFGYYTEDARLKLALEVILDRGGLKLKLTMSFRIAWGASGQLAPV